MLSDFVDWYFASAWFTIPATLWAVSQKLQKNLIDSPVFRKDLSNLIGQNSFREIYKTNLLRVLDWVDRRLAQDEARRGSELGSASRSWSFGLLCLSITFAYTYPLVSGLIQWMFGEELWLTSVPILAQAVSNFEKVSYLLACTILMWPWSYIPLFRRVWPADFAVRPKHAEIVLRGLMALAIIWIPIGEHSTGLVMSAQGGSSETGMIFMTGHSERVLLACLAVMFLAFRSPVFALLAANIFALVGVFLDFSNPVSLGATVLFLSLLYTKWADWMFLVPVEKKKVALALLLVSICLIMSVALYLGLGGPLAENSTLNTAESRATLIYLFLYPILNIPADFLSIGATVYLLRKSLSITKLMIFLDLVLAIVIFFILIASFVSFVHFVRGGDSTLVSLRSIIQQVIYFDYRFVWYLGFFAFSTLLPSLFHLLMVVASVLVTWPRFIAGSVSKTLTGEPIYVVIGWAILSAWVIFGTSFLGWVILSTGVVAQRRFEA